MTQNGEKTKRFGIKSEKKKVHLIVFVLKSGARSFIFITKRIQQLRGQTELAMLSNKKQITCMQIFCGVCFYRHRFDKNKVSIVIV